MGNIVVITIIADADEVLGDDTDYPGQTVNADFINSYIEGAYGTESPAQLVPGVTVIGYSAAVVGHDKTTN